MPEQEKDKQLDDLLESLLSTYSAEEPLPGMETRILASVRDAAAEKRSRFWNLRWLWAGAAGVAVAAVIMFILFSRPAPRPQPQVVREVVPASPRISPPAKAAVRAVAAPRRPIHNRNQGPRELAVALRPSVFPTPSPLSEQEALLLRYLATTPREELIAQSRPDAGPARLEEESAPPRDLTQIPQRSSNTR
jgi:hypothetical protein